MIYLASQSPRRQALLRQIGIEFEILAIEINEQYLASEPVVDYVKRMALEKAIAGNDWLVSQSIDRLPVLGADTVVVVGDRVLGKPENKANAIEYLQTLSARAHQVYTAVAIVSAGQQHIALSETQVRFRAITELECDAYWETGEPQGKAGAYAIQGLAAMFVEHLSGSYSGVMGLPLFETSRLLAEIGYSIASNELKS